MHPGVTVRSATVADRDGILSVVRAAFSGDRDAKDSGDRDAKDAGDRDAKDSRDRDAKDSRDRDAKDSRDRDAKEELDIVATTWTLEAIPDGLELVAVEDDAVVGHVLGARGDLGGRDVVAVAPLCVAPARHRKGIGTLLMTELIRRADAGGLPLLALLGSPVYYGRFGFEPSGPLGIVYEPVGADSPYFQVRRLQRYDPSYRGAFTYCWEA